MGGEQVVLAGTIKPMQKREKSRKRKAVAQAGASKKRARLSGSGDYTYSYKGATPFAGVGRVLGSKLSRYLPFGDLSDIGAAAGHAIGRIMGSGDYSTGPMVKSNVLVNSTEVPQFAGLGRGTVITHREYIGDVITSSTIGGFANNVFIIQPGNGKTFPWLSTVAQNYQQYKVHGMVFYFKSTSGDSVGSTNTSLGTVIMATEYNINDADYTNKISMENSEFAQSGKPSISQMHAVECDTRDRAVENYFVRTDDAVTSQDKWYDFAKFQLATVGFPAASVNIGEVWVSYVIEFLKPQVPMTPGGNMNTYNAYATAGLSAANPMGTSLVAYGGSLRVAITGTSFVVTGVLPGQVYQIQFYCDGAGTVITQPTSTLSGWANSTWPSKSPAELYAPSNGETATRAIYTRTLVVNDTNTTGVVSFTITGSVFPRINAYLTIMQLDNSVLG
jgi:hypothetical protein